MVLSWNETTRLGPGCNVDIKREQSPIKLVEFALDTQMLLILHQLYLRHTLRPSKGLRWTWKLVRVGVSLFQSLRAWPSLPGPLFPKPRKEPDPKGLKKGFQ